MKTKLEMANEWYMKHSESPSFMDPEIRMAWDYADAMQAEADKREKEKATKEAESHKTFMDMLNQEKQNHHDELVSIGLEDWQPDWSQAPEWANYWYTGGSMATWSSHNPKSYDPFDIKHYPIGLLVDQAPLFDYKGDWLDSLRKRP